MKKFLSLMGCTLLCFAIAGCDDYVKGDPSAICKLGQANATEEVLFYSEDDVVKSLEYITLGTTTSESEAKTVAVAAQAMIDNYIEEYDAENAYVEVNGLDIKIAYEIEAGDKFRTGSVDEVMAGFEIKGYVCERKDIS